MKQFLQDYIAEYALLEAKALDNTVRYCLNQVGLDGMM